MDCYFLRRICRSGSRSGEPMRANIVEIKSGYGKITAEYVANELQLTLL